MYKETSFSNANLETYLITISCPRLIKEESETLDGGIKKITAHCMIKWCSKTIGTTSRRVWSNKQTEV